MQRGASADTRGTIPGIFETIAAAMSLLLVQPLLLAVPLLIDVYLWLGSRITPERMLEPLAAVLETQASLEAETLRTTLDNLSQEGNLVDLVGIFVPSLAGSVGAQNLTAPWARNVIDPGSAGVSLLLTVGFLMIGALGLMTLMVMMARLVRQGSALGQGAGRMIGLATVRYLGFLAILIPVMLMAVIAGSLVASLASVISVFLASLVVMGVIIVVFTIAILLSFVGDAIALADVGPARAVELSAGVVRRYPWASIGLLLVTSVSLVTIPELVLRINLDSALLVIVAMVLFAFIATGLALARMRFFSDRLAQWQPGLVRSLA